MLRKLFGRKDEPNADSHTEPTPTVAKPRYTPDSDSTLRMTITELLFRYGLFNRADDFARRDLDYLLDLQHKVTEEFTKREEKWKRSELSKGEIKVLNDAISSSSLGSTSAPTLNHPASFWGPLSHPKIPADVKRKLYRRGLEVITWPPDRHFLLMGALESRDGIVPDSEREDTLRMFAENRPIAARYMDAYGAGQPPNMGEDLLVDPQTTEWPAYHPVFFEVKTGFSKIDEWRKVHEIWHAHTKLSHELRQTYKQRDEIGLEPSITICRQLIQIAPEAKVALKRDHDLWFEYRTELQSKFLAQRGRQPDEGWMPAYKEFTLPQHPGFKQLVIIYDKMKEPQKAIDVCREALNLGWPGDWDVRIARYEKRLATANKRSKKVSDGSGNVVTIDPKKPSPRTKFCDQCGSMLEDDAKFCPQCGSRIDRAGN